jgi:hypothetical protein
VAILSAGYYARHRQGEPPLCRRRAAGIRSTFAVLMPTPTVKTKALVH